jgi:outer membrane lipoprotein-sorting protein
MGWVPPAFLVMLLLTLSSVGGTTETARHILDRRKALSDGPEHWDDREQLMKLTITDGRGGTRERELKLFERRFPNDDSKTVLFFRAPADVRGTAFLAFDHRGKRADQWLYLPALKRTRQITANMRDQSFVGTDLSYHDLDLLQEMIDWTEEDARSSLRGQETVDGVETYVIELDPQHDDIRYEKIVLWLGTGDLVPRKLEFYEDGAEPVKRIVQRRVEKVGKVPVAREAEIARPQKGSRTVLEVAEVQFDRGLEDDLFTERTLEQGEP